MLNTSLYQFLLLFFSCLDLGNNKKFDGWKKNFWPSVPVYILLCSGAVGISSASAEKWSISFHFCVSWRVSVSAGDRLTPFPCQEQVLCLKHGEAKVLEMEEKKWFRKGLGSFATFALCSGLDLEIE